MKNRVLSKLAFALPLLILSAGDLYARSRRYSSSSSSSSGFSCVILIGIIGFFVGLVVMMFLADKRRSKKIQAIATRLGFPFRREATEADRMLIAGSHIANTGHGHTTSNVLEVSQSEELRMSLFDYSYTVGYGKSRQHYHQTITRMQSPVLNLPAFFLFPETFFSKVGKLFGGADINFAESPQFSKKYILRGADEAAIRALFTPALRQFFESQLPFTVEAAGTTVFVYRTSQRAKPEQLEGYIAAGKQVLAQLFEAQNSRPSGPPPLPVSGPPPLPS